MTPWWVVLAVGIIGPLLAYVAARRGSADQREVARLDKILGGLNDLAAGYERKSDKLEVQLDAERAACNERIEAERRANERLRSDMERQIEQLRAKVDGVAAEVKNG